MGKFGYRDSRPRCGFWVGIALLAALAPGARTEEHAPKVEHVAFRTRLIYAGKRAGWVELDRARELGFIEYRGRWLPGKLKRKLAVWERKDARVHGWQDAYKARSRHYRIETDIPHFSVELDIKPFLDELYKTYTDVFRRDFGLKGRGANNKEIKIYNGYPEYARLAKDGMPVVPRTNPGFIRNGKEIVVYYGETEPEIFYGTVFHEGAHQFVKNLLPGADLPLWLDEALAVYFEGCRYQRSTGKIFVGHLPPDRLEDAQEALRQVKPIAGVSLAETMFMHHGEANFTAREYALAWSFVYYLTHAEDGKHRKKFARFLKATNGAGRKPIATTFREAFGVSLEKMGVGWREYVLALQAEPSPRWLELEIAGELPDGVDLENGDRLWSLDGRPMQTVAAFEAAWPGTPPERGTTWTVVRRREDGSEHFVKTTVPAGASVAIQVPRHWRRKHSLVD